MNLETSWICVLLNCQCSKSLMHYWLQKWWFIATLSWYLCKQHQYSLLNFKIGSLETYDNTLSLLGSFWCTFKDSSHWFSFVNNFIQTFIPSILIFYTKVHCLLIFYIGLFMFFSSILALLVPFSNGCIQPAIKIKWVFPLLMVI